MTPADVLRKAADLRDANPGMYSSWDAVTEVCGADTDLRRVLLDMTWYANTMRAAADAWDAAHPSDERTTT